MIDKRSAMSDLLWPSPAIWSEEPKHNITWPTVIASYPDLALFPVWRWQSVRLVPVSLCQTWVSVCINKASWPLLAYYAQRLGAYVNNTVLQQYTDTLKWCVCDWEYFFCQCLHLIWKPGDEANLDSTLVCVQWPSSQYLWLSLPCLCKSYTQCN